jgi:hypothetical protein
MDTLGDDYILIPQDFGMIREVLSGRSLIEKGRNRKRSQSYD